MTRRSFSLVSAGISMLVLLLLAGCGSDVTPSTTSGTTPTSAPTATSATPAVTLAKSFSDPEGLGYSIGYPEDWTYSKADEFTVLFKGTKESAKGYVATVNVQNILSAAKGGSYKNIDELHNDLKAQLSQGDSKLISEASFPYAAPGGVSLIGRQMVVEYSLDGEKYRQWQISLPGLPNSGVLHAWAYTSPVDVYDGSYATAKAMLDSWKVGG